LFLVNREQGVGADDERALPPGRARLATKPAPTGSVACTKTIDTVRVASSNGPAVALPTVKMTSGESETNSAAYLRMPGICAKRRQRCGAAHCQAEVGESCAARAAAFCESLGGPPGAISLTISSMTLALEELLEDVLLLLGVSMPAF
jgi:hypothetical protein